MAIMSAARNNTWHELQTLISLACWYITVSILHEHENNCRPNLPKAPPTGIALFVEDRKLTKQSEYGLAEAWTGNTPLD